MDRCNQCLKATGRLRRLAEGTVPGITRFVYTRIYTGNSRGQSESLRKHSKKLVSGYSVGVRLFLACM